MRKITKIIIHCSAIKEGKDYTVEILIVGIRGGKGIGYHFVFYRDVSIHVGRAKNEIGAHYPGQNSIGICHIGALSSNGKLKDTCIPLRRAAMLSLIEQLCEEFPRVTLHGHNEFANKACPCFKISDEL